MPATSRRPSPPGTRFLHAALVLACTVALSACAPLQPKENTMDPDLEAAILGQVQAANGVFVSHSSSGFGNTELLVRLYLDPVEQDALAAAVDSGLRTAWLAWPEKPTGVELG